MRNELMWDLADCTEFRQTLQARPPRIVHGTLLLLAALLATALVWSAVTQADLVVRAPGRVRPVTSPMKVVNAGSGEVLSASAGGRVVEVQCSRRAGGAPRRRPDPAGYRAAGQRDREAAAGDPGRGGGAGGTGPPGAVAGAPVRVHRAKAEAELAQAREEVRQATDRQAADVRLAELELQNAQHEEAQVRQLVERQLVARDDLRKATARVREAQERLDKARLPVDTGRVEVLRRALELAEQDYAVRRQELHTKQGDQAGGSRGPPDRAGQPGAGAQAGGHSCADGRDRDDGDVKVGDILERGSRWWRSRSSRASASRRRSRARRSATCGSGCRRGSSWMPTTTAVRHGGGDSGLHLAGLGVPAGQGTATYLVRIELEGEELGRGDSRAGQAGMAGQAEIVTGQESLLRAPGEEAAPDHQSGMTVG